MYDLATHTNTQQHRFSGLGVKGSQVQILSARPAYCLVRTCSGGPGGKPRNHRSSAATANLTAGLPRQVERGDLFSRPSVASPEEPWCNDARRDGRCSVNARLELPTEPGGARTSTAVRRPKRWPRPTRRSRARPSVHPSVTRPARSATGLHPRSSARALTSGPSSLELVRETGRHPAWSQSALISSR